MFTGIIEDVGSLVRCEAGDRGIRLYIQTHLASELVPGQSVAVNGVCLTAAKCFDDKFEVTAIPETLRKTNLGELQPGARLNLERALEIGTRLDGHMVQGHVDAACRITQVVNSDGERRYTFKLPAEFASLAIHTGSVAIDGISLTIAHLHRLQLTVAIIPHTYEHTNVQTWTVGGRCNVEFDVLGKYVARQLKIIQAA